jgi:hypothetical protein
MQVSPTGTSPPSSPTALVPVEEQKLCWWDIVFSIIEFPFIEQQNAGAGTKFFMQDDELRFHKYNAGISVIGYGFSIQSVQRCTTNFFGPGGYLPLSFVKGEQATHDCIASFGPGITNFLDTFHKNREKEVQDQANYCFEHGIIPGLEKIKVVNKKYTTLTNLINTWLALIYKAMENATYDYQSLPDSPFGGKVKLLVSDERLTEINLILKNSLKKGDQETFEELKKHHMDVNLSYKKLKQDATNVIFMEPIHSKVMPIPKKEPLTDQKLFSNSFPSPSSSPSLPNSSLQQREANESLKGDNRTSSEPINIEQKEEQTEEGTPSNSLPSPTPSPSQSPLLSASPAGSHTLSSSPTLSMLNN